MSNYKYFILEGITLVKSDNTYLKIDINKNLGEDLKYNLCYNIFKNLIKHHCDLFSDFPNIIYELKED